MCGNEERQQGLKGCQKGKKTRVESNDGKTLKREIFMSRLLLLGKLARGKEVEIGD